MSEVEKVCKVSDEENLQPFKDKMDDFLTKGKRTTCYLRESLSCRINLQQTVYDGDNIQHWMFSVATQRGRNSTS